MSRWIICAIVLAWAVTGCSGAGADGGSGQSLAKVTQAASTCKNFDGYTAALAEATIDCLGAIGPKDYTSDATGLLVPTFDRCPAEVMDQKGPSSAMLRIRRLLSLQLSIGTRQEAARVAAVCIRDAYLSAAKALIGSGVNVCPNWHKEFVGGSPTRAWKRLTPPEYSPPPYVVALSKRMPRPHLIQPGTTDQKPYLAIDLPKRGSGFRFPKEYIFYTVSFDNVTAPPEQKGCTGAVSCAKACSTLFEGFLVGRFGKYLVGDPYWWLDPTDYGGFDQWNDPYNRVNGFYHPMSLAGDDVPGELYGDFARAAFEDPNLADDSGEAELCTLWDGTDHRMARLIQDRLLDDPATWLSRCEPYPPSVTPVLPF